MNTIPIEKQNTLMVAHRGVSGLEKENTMAAFIAAGNRSYWGIETDVHRTSDGKYIAIHDSNTRRVAGESFLVEDTSYELLRALPLLDENGEAGRNDLRMPSLREYIRVCKKYEKKAVLELKNRFEEEDILHILQEIREEDYLDQTVFIAFDTDNLRHIRRHCPLQAVQQLSSSLDEALFELICQERYDLDVRYSELTEEWVKRLHEKGIAVNCWTVNDPQAAQTLVSWGVDFLTTNILE